MADHGWVLVREFNGGLALLALAGMGWRWRYFRQQDRAVQLVLAAAGAMVASLGYASIEIVMMQRPVPGGVRVLLITVALTLFLLALAGARPARRRSPSGGDAVVRARR